MKEVESRLKEEAKKILDEVAYVVGYQEGLTPLSARPLFITNPREVDRLVYNDFCATNLANYVKKSDQKIGIDQKVGLIVKGCDSRSVVQLLQEGILQRENMILIGVPCRGMISFKKIEKLFDPLEAYLAEVRDKKLKVHLAQGEQSYHLEDVVFEKCLWCETTEPLIVDIMIEGPLSFELEQRERNFDIVELEKKEPAELFDFWTAQFEKCIRCYACRNACPLCYCQDNCLADTRQPHWLGQQTDAINNFMYHMIRAMHVVGRCTGCQECERVCPVDIPISQLFRKTSMITEQLFDYTPGMKIEDVPPLLTFKKDEKF